MANFKSDILDIATKGMNHHKQMMLDLIEGYIKEHQTRYKVKGCSNYMTAIVIEYYQGNEQILSNNKDKAVSYANNKRKSIKIPNNGAEIIKLFFKNEWNTKHPINIKWRLFVITEDGGTLLSVGCDIKKHKTGEICKQLLSSDYFVNHFDVGDQIELSITIKSEEIRMTMEIKYNYDIVTIPFKTEKNYRTDLKWKLKDDYIVVPIIQLEHDGLQRGVVNGTGSEIHLISYSVTFDH